MLYEEEGDEILSTIAANSNASKEVRQFCISIMELLKVEGLIRNEKNALKPSMIFIYKATQLGEIIFKE
jgi:hypothetical protein